MNRRTNTQYRIATFFAVTGLLTYGIVRLLERDPYSVIATYSWVPFYLSLATATLVFVEYVLFKKYEFMPFMVVSTMIVTMTIGAYVSKEWDYYYLATLGMTGIMCLYGKVRPMMLHQAANVTLNIFILCFLLNDLPESYRTRMLNSFLLYVYAAVFLMVMFYQAHKKESSARSGLQAFSLLLGSTPNLMVIVDDKRIVRHISAPLARFAGLSEAVAVGRPLVDLFKTESLKLMFADILDAEGFYSATREIDMNDEAHYFKIIADKLSASDTGMFIEITDMTEIVLASMEADKARKEAEAANKSKSDFLTTMSHEIRTPMNAIIGMSEIQLLRKDLPEDVNKALKQIYISSHGLLGIINDILDLSKIETGKLEIAPLEYDVPSLINDAVQLNIIRIGSKPIVFSLDITGDLPARLVGDEIRLKQILNNILSNAFKYTDEGTVKLSFTHRVCEKGIELIFKVADTGQGMKPEDLARLYEQYARFNTTSNRTTEGTGLGMNITQSLVRLMDGQIDVESEYGKGSVFTVTVLQQPAEDRSVIGEEYAEKLRNFTYTIDREIQSIHITREYMPYGKVLVVDDVETNLHVARGLLTPYGLTIETASSGFEVVKKISDGEVYDIVFMDHMMPLMDGVETTQKLRESGYKGTIVALTANAIAGNDKFFKENGFEDFISKPIDMRQMNAILNRYIRDRQPPKVIPSLANVNSGNPVLPVGVGIDKTLLDIFKRDARKAIVTLTQTVENGDYKLFATTAHAMKSACANIGEEAISTLAKSLEDAGNNRDKAFIEAHTPALIDALSAITGDVKNKDKNDYQNGDENEHQDNRDGQDGRDGRDNQDSRDSRDNRQGKKISDTDRALWLEKLAQIREACDEYDGGTARTLLNELREKTWDAETEAAVDDLSEMVLCSDFEEAVEAAEKMAEKLKES